MGRVRNINPKAPTEEDVAALSIHARYVWAYLPCHADREGRLEDAPLRLKGQILPNDQVNMRLLLDELERARFIRRYTVNGRPYIHIRQFLKHQRPREDERQTTLPAPPPDPFEDDTDSTPTRDETDTDSTRVQYEPDTDQDRGHDEPTVNPRSGIPGSRDPGRSPPSACDPSGEEPPPKRCSGSDLVRWYGVERTRVVPDALDWKTPRGNEKAARLAEDLTPEEIRDVRPTMRLHFAELKAGEGDPKALVVPTLGFGWWLSDFTRLREKLHGRAQAAIAAAQARASPAAPKIEPIPDVTGLSKRPRQNGGWPDRPAPPSEPAAEDPGKETQP